jgi:hypothetical protein
MMKIFDVITNDVSSTDLKIVLHEKCIMFQHIVLTKKHKTKSVFFFQFKEWATPVIERANKIALTTTEQIVKKDYSLDPDENRIRSAAHNMVRNLTSGMAMITCRDHLLKSIKNHLTHFMVTLGRNLTQQVNYSDFFKNKVRKGLLRKDNFPLVVVHKLRLQDELCSRFKIMSTFCQHSYYRKCQRWGVGGQKIQKSCQLSCERPLTLCTEMSFRRYLSGSKNLQNTFT